MYPRNFYNLVWEDLSQQAHDVSQIDVMYPLGSRLLLDTLEVNWSFVLFSIEIMKFSIFTVEQKLCTLPDYGYNVTWTIFEILALLAPAAPAGT